MEVGQMYFSPKRRSVSALFAVMLVVSFLAACSDSSHQSKTGTATSAPTPTVPLGPRYKASLSEGIAFNRDGYPDFVASVRGISVPDKSGRWTDGPQTIIEFLKPLPKKFTLKISAGAVPYWQNKPIRITVGTTTFDAKFGKPGSWTAPTDVALPVATDGTAKSVVFEFPDVKSPKELGLADEYRKIVLYLSSIKIDQ